MNDQPEPPLPITEQDNPRTSDLSSRTVTEILGLINEEDSGVPAAVARELPAIGRAVEAIVERMRGGGRLLYVGCGTSGRLGVLDASECPPTFGTPPEMVQGIIAGGVAALTSAQEGAEDNLDQARIDLTARGVRAGDFVVGIAASGKIGR